MWDLEWIKCALRNCDPFLKELCLYAYMCACVWMRMHRCVHVYVCVCICMCISVHMCLYICVCVCVSISSVIIWGFFSLLVCSFLFLFFYFCCLVFLTCLFFSFWFCFLFLFCSFHLWEKCRDVSLGRKYLWGGKWRGTMIRLHCMKITLFPT